MNFASEEQLEAVGMACRHYAPRAQGFTSSVVNPSGNGISCNSCKNWDGARCTIDVFDKVLTSLDQT